MQRCVASLLALLAFEHASRAAALPDFATRSGAPVELSADSLLLDSKRALYEARGSVVIRQGDRILHADWVVFNERTGTAVASGSVVLDQAGKRLVAKFLEFDVFTLEGVVFEAELEGSGGGFRISGSEITRTSETTYSVRDGVFTTCRCPEEGREPWQITAEEAEVEIGGYGTARNTTFDVLGVPVLWFPWMLYPLKTERETGLLLPELHIGDRNGVDVGLPIFWAARPDLNVTFTPHWLSERGPKEDLELEYVLGQHSGGSLGGAYIRDHKIDPDTPQTPFGRDRWSVLGQQDLHLPEQVRFKADFAFESDNSYPFDFAELRVFQGDRFLESRAFAWRGFGPEDRFGAGVAAFRADDLQNPNNQDRDPFLLQRLPSVELAALSAPLPGAPWLVTALDVGYIDFWYRRDPRNALPQAVSLGEVRGAPPLFLDTGIDAIPGNQAQDPTENDTRFEEGEPLVDHGQRLDLWPRIRVPLRLLDLFELRSEAGWRETLYTTEEQGFAQRGFFTGLAELSTSLRRDFGEIVHVLEPRLAWTLVTHSLGSDEQNPLGAGGLDGPLFVPATAVPQVRVRQLELENVLADPADRVERVDALTYGVGSRLYRRGVPGEGLVLLADVALSNQFDLVSGELQNLVLDGRAYPLPLTRLRFNVGVDPRSAQVSEGLAQVTGSDRRGDSASLSYRYLRQIPDFFEDFTQNERFEEFRQLNSVSQVDASLRVALTKEWAVSYAVGYSFDDSFLIRNQGTIEYFSRCQCWGAGIAVSDDRSQGFSIRPLITIVGLGGRHGLRPTSLNFLDGP